MNSKRKNWAIITEGRSYSVRFETKLMRDIEIDSKILKERKEERGRERERDRRIVNAYL